MLFVKIQARPTTVSKYWVLLFFILYPGFVQSQFEHKVFTNNLHAEVKAYYGFVYAHTLPLEIFNSHLPAFEVNIIKETYGVHKWERMYNYPLVGVALWYSTLGKSPYLGDAYALFPFINFPLVKNDKLYVGFRFGLGLGYLTKHFDRLENYKNLAIGGHFNAAVNLMFELRYPVGEWVTLSSGLCLQHFSNGALKLPNYGINLPLLNVGVAYRLDRKNRIIGDRFIAPTEPYSAILRKKMEFNVGAMVGYKNMQQVYGENFFVFHLYENTFFRIGDKSKGGFGLDLSYDQSHVKKLEMSGSVVTTPFAILRPGINGAYALNFSRFNFIVNLGYYLGGQETSNGPLYEKLSLQYNFTKSFFGNVMLKVHWGRADYIGWGVGYSFTQTYGKKLMK